MRQEFEVSPGRGRTYLFAGCAVLLTLVVLCGGVYLIIDRVFLADEAPVAALGQTATPTPAGTTRPATPFPAGAPRPGRIAFVAGDGQIGSVAPDGSDERRLTDDDRLYLFPAWSPTGGRLAAIGGDTTGSGVFVVEDVAGEAPGATVREVYASAEEAPIYLYWAPDGQRVSFIANNPAGLGLHLVPADGSAESRVLTTGQPFYWDWSGNNEQVFIHTGGSDEEGRLAVVDVAGADDGATLARPGFFQAPGISAGGRFLAYAESDPAGERQLVVQDTESGTAETVPHDGAVAMGWSPTAPLLAFTSPEPTGEAAFDFWGPLRLFDAETGAVDVLVEDLVVAFFWAPDGQSIAYLTLADGQGEQNAARDGRFATFARRRQQHSGLRLGLWLVDVASGDIDRVITFAPPELFVTQFLPFFDQYALSHRLWAPDSSALVLPILEGETARVFVVPVDRQGIRPVAEGNMAFWSW